MSRFLVQKVTAISTVHSVALKPAGSSWGRFCNSRPFSSVEPNAKAMEPKPRRAMLYVPGSDERKLRKLTDLTADCAVMDCEDAVAVNKKVDARNTVRFMLDDLRCPSIGDLAVRVNSVSSGLADEDLTEILKADRLPDTILLPKVESKQELQWFVAKVESLLRARAPEAPMLRVVIFTETAIGLLHLQEILEECRRAAGEHLVFEGVVFGSDDFCASIGATRTADARELLYARQKVVATAKAYGMQAIDLVYIDFKGCTAVILSMLQVEPSGQEEVCARRDLSRAATDLDGLEKQSIEGAKMGFTGKQVIHPNQVPVVQKAFSPSQAQIDWAVELIDAFEQHQSTGKGAFDFKGTMIDMPTVRQARNILRLRDSTR